MNKINFEKLKNECPRVQALFLEYFQKTGVQDFFLFVALHSIHVELKPLIGQFDFKFKGYSYVIYDISANDINRVQVYKSKQSYLDRIEAHSNAIFEAAFVLEKRLFIIENN